MIVYVNGKYLEENNASVNVNDRGYLFSDGAYEGFRIYNNKIFKLQEHKDRFQRSLNELKISYTIENEIEEILTKNPNSHIITTAKDLVKLEQFKIKDIYLMDLELELDGKINFTHLNEYINNA